MDSLCKQNFAVNVDMELLKVCFYGLNHNPPPLLYQSLLSWQFIRKV